jgi:hypothetical protein
MGIFGHKTDELTGKRRKFTLRIIVIVLFTNCNYNNQSNKDAVGGYVKRIHDTRNNFKNFVRKSEERKNIYKEYIYKTVLNLST